MTTVTEKEIIETLFENCEEDLYERYKDNVKATEKLWSLADLFIRQWKNNMCDGFDMINVKDTYHYLVKHKSSLLEYDLISEKGINNSGFPLWENYAIEWDGIAY